MGTYGRASFDEHPDEESAQAALAALMLAKQKRGYRDVLPSMRHPTVQWGHHNGPPFAPAPIDEAAEPPLPL
jgi:predicted DNA-binding WGR domain protein